MALSEYHSPQFSEDPAWLPAWLQPYEQTNTEFEGQNQGNATTFKACQFLQENLCEAGNTQLTASRGAKYTCNLYLSGDDYQQPGSASCSNAISLHLHLSSTSFSHVRSAQSNEIPVLCKHEMNKSPSQKSISKNPVNAHGLAYQYSRTDQAQRLDSSPEVFKQNVSSEHDTDQPIKSNQNTEKDCHVNLDSGRLKYTVVDDLVEMSIAASEALVISEMAFTSMHSKSFSDAAILEIALRVKRARNESMLETPHEFSTGDTDDIDQILELDENSMYGAFEDVGIAVPLKTSNHPFSCRKSSIGTQGSDTNQQEIVMPDSSYSGNMLAVDYGDEGETITERIKGANTSTTSSKICSPLDCKLQSNSMGAEGLQVETNALDNLPVDYTKQCLIDSSLVQAQKMHILDALPVNQMSSMEHHCLQKVEKNSEPSTVKVKKSMKLFKWETSFLSESMDALEQGVSQNKPSVELEIVASSNTALQVSPALCKEYKHEEPLSQDYSRSLSLADPLCSIVPCSISSEIDAVKMSKNPICSMYSKYLDEDSTVQENSMLQKPFFGSREFIFSETRFEQPSIPLRKQLNSLRPYSLPTDHHKMAELSNSSCIQLPLHDINGASMHSSSEVIVKCSHKNDIGLTGQCLFTGKSSNEHILNQNKIEVTTLSFRNMETYDTRSPVHEDACLSPIHGSMNQPCEGCEVSTCGDRDESTKRSPTSDFVKCRSDCSTKEASYRNKTINKYHVPLQSNLHSLPADERPMKKRVRFQEATCNMGMPKTSSLQSKCPSQCSFPWTTKQLQDYSLLYKPDAGRDLNVNYFTSNGAIWSDSMILQGLDFLLTGFSSCKAKDIEELIRKHGGYVLQSIPSVSLYLRGKSIRSASRKLPVVLCLKKVQTTKFLYGCAINTFMLNHHWLEDSIQSGGILPPWKYMTRSVPYSKREKLVIGKPLYLNNDMPIFNKAGIMVHGKVKFCAKFMKIIKHGGGQVFKSLQRLVQSLKNGTNTLGIILVKNESCISRHLKHCALEHDIPTMSASWIISSLFSGKLLPLKKDRCAPFRRIKMPAFPTQLVEMSQEI